MQVGLPVVAFLSAALLAGIIPAYWSCRSSPMLYLIAWLFACNVIQGANAVIWAGNSTIRCEVWCDIATKVLLGAWVALPAACLCRSHRLLQCTTQREIHRGLLVSLEFCLCVVLPVLYMALQLIVQDHRFDLAENYGCVSSIYVSPLALLVVWLPCFVLCAAALLHAAVSSFVVAVTFQLTLRKSTIGICTFVRPVLTTVAIASLVMSASASSLHAALVTAGGLQPWTSFSVIHSQLSSVRVVPPTASIQLTGIAVMWWIVPVCSEILVIMSWIGLVCNNRDEMFDGYRWFLRWFRRTILRQEVAVRLDEPVLRVPRQLILRFPDSPLPIHSLKPGSQGSPTPLTPKSKLEPLTIAIPGRGPYSPPPISPDSDDSEDAFAQSALKYVQSPIGRKASQKLAHPPALPRPVKPVPPPLDLQIPSAAVVRPGSEQEAGSSLSNAILNSPWPRPPSTVPTPVAGIAIHPPTPEPEPDSGAPRRPDSALSLSTTLASSTISTSAYATGPVADKALNDSPTLPYFPPFVDASVPAPQNLAVPKRSKRRSSKERLAGARTLSLNTRSRHRAHESDDSAFGHIYMTVVQETV